MCVCVEAYLELVKGGEKMDLTVFQYITEIPEVIDNQTWYTLAVMGYNLGLTFFWTFLVLWLLDDLFKAFSKIYKGR